MRKETKSQALFLLISLILFSSGLIAQPSPGDVFKEYLWFNDVNDCGGALRVGVSQYDITSVGLCAPFQCGISRRTFEFEGWQRELFRI